MPPQHEQGSEDEAGRGGETRRCLRSAVKNKPEARSSGACFVSCEKSPRGLPFADGPEISGFAAIPRRNSPHQSQEKPMKKKSPSQSGVSRKRVLLGLALGSVSVLLAVFTFAGMPARLVQQTEDLPRYMPVPGGKANDLNGMEVDWHNRLTYPDWPFRPGLGAPGRRAGRLRSHDGIPAGTRVDRSNQTNAPHPRPQWLHRARPEAPADDRLLGLLQLPTHRGPGERHRHRSDDDHERQHRGLRATSAAACGRPRTAAAVPPPGPPSRTIR